MTKESPALSYLRGQKQVIASVFPMELRTERRHNGFTTYILPPAPRDGFSATTITGTVDFGIDHTTEPSQLIERPVPLDVVVEDLVRTWTTTTLGATTEMGPGVGPIEGETPTPEELAALRARQTEYFRMLVYDADVMFAKGDIQKIITVHREAAKWLGLEGRPWVQEISFTQVKHCAACGETIPAAAAKCKICGQDLLEWAQKWGTTQEEDPFVFARLQALQKPKAPAPKASAGGNA